MNVAIRHILLMMICLCGWSVHVSAIQLKFEFLSDTMQMNVNENFKVPFDEALSDEAITHFYDQMNNADWQPVVEQLHQIQSSKQLNDWLYYQLIRKNGRATQSES